MRKIIAILLAAAMLSGLCACDAVEPEISISGNHDTDLKGVSLEILSARRTEEEGTVLKVRWNNQTDYEVLYGEAYKIQRLEGDSWVDLSPRPNTGFTAIGYHLNPHSSTTKTYELDWIYDVSKAGTYRFVSDCRVYETPTGTDCDLWAEFQVENSVPKDLKIDARYIRTDGNREGRKYPEAVLLTEREALEGYYIENRGFYNLDGNGPARFYTAMLGYNDVFFAKYDLLMVLLHEGSGSITHKVSKLEYSDGILSAWIDRNVPQAGTCDEALWHLLIPVEKSCEADHIRIYLDGNLAMENRAVTPNISWAEAEFTSPPKLSLLFDGAEAEAFGGGYTWSHAVGDGTWSTVCADSLHPLQMEKHVQLISCGSNQVHLEFASVPDSVMVRCWPGNTWGNTNAASEQASICDGILSLKGGDWVYEVTATWKNDGSSYYGTASYVFYAVPAVQYIYLQSKTAATVHLAGESFSFEGKKAFVLNEILANLSYDPQMICDCMAEFRADTESGQDYQIHLTEEFVRCEKGQAKLTKEQVEILREILEWAEEETKAR